VKKYLSCLISACCLLWATPVFAETPFETLALFRQQYPPVMSDAQRGELLNRVAWVYRESGMALLGKNGGANCPMPNGVRISCDYLVWTADAPMYSGHDVLSGKTDGTTAVVGFTWGPGKEDLTDAIKSGSRTVVRPILPDSSDEPAPGPAPTPNPTPEPVTGEIVQRLTIIEQVVAEIRQQNLLHETEEAKEREKAEAFRQAVGHEWQKFGMFVTKYVLPVVGALLLGREIGQ
jgi:hypothetical protein